RKRIGSAKAAAAQDRLIVALVQRGIAAVVVEALIGIGRAPASAGPRRLAPLRARPALGVSVREQQSHYCATEQNKTDRAHGSSPSPSFCAANEKGEAASPPSKPMNSRRCISMTPSPRTMRSIAGRASQQNRPAHVRSGSKAADQSRQRFRPMSALPPKSGHRSGHSRRQLWRTLPSL